jgi:hypothetical protein
MTITRRVFMTGLAAMLSVAPAASLFSRQRDEELEKSEAKVNANGQTLEEAIHAIWTEPVNLVAYHDIGECPDMLGGPAKKSGWYIHPDCMVGCCPSEGPYSSREEAEKLYRSKWEKSVRECFSRIEESSTPYDYANGENLPELEPF